ncbi:glutathione S-transferase family protein [Thalassococcus sp. S3]|uniref:glutathione S-transferase family protein n=1 Tax=Thalassococcus sp. S3 TaxID=2017482 RepID=UPI0010245A81|nr:glutathione S-transferase family protein [Thalassococcus sp. S3]QBF30779.1 glutathione S-transferase [Thalassococcus sp. S3]
MKLFFSRNFNPRLAVAVARHLGVEVEFEFAAPLEPSQRDRFRLLNPNLLLPILIEGDTGLWEADAIACRLSQIAGSDFWRWGQTAPDMIRWISWGRANFVAACDKVHFERVTKRRYGLGPTSEDEIANGLEQFATAASLLDGHLERSEWLLTDGLSYADFRMACVLPSADLAGLPLDRYANVSAWHARLWAIDAWREPFAGLDAPELPPIS